MKVRIQKVIAASGITSRRKAEELIQRGKVTLNEFFRILGSVTPERLRILREADDIVGQEIKNFGLYRELWQAFAVLLPIRSVGVMGDQRTYEHVLAIRAVTSVDAMTADWAKLPYELLDMLSNRLINEVKGINRVVYDVSSKPPATIEWE